MTFHQELVYILYKCLIYGKCQLRHCLKTAETKTQYSICKLLIEND